METPIIIVVLVILLILLGIYAYRVSRMVEKYENYILDLRESFKITQKKINSPELASAFEADDSTDSVGFTFRWIRQAINDLEEVITVEGNSENEEKVENDRHV